MGNVIGHNNVGGMVGIADGDTGINTTDVSNIYVSGNDNVGGFVGKTTGNLGMYWTGMNSINVTGNDNVGGLVGNSVSGVAKIRQMSLGNSSIIGNNYVGGAIGIAGTVEHNVKVGLIIHEGDMFNIQNSNVNGVNYVGGLIGYSNADSNIKYYQSSAVNLKGNDYVGGLIGLNKGALTLSISGFDGNVTGEDYVGGLVGLNILDAQISESSFDGNVTGEDYVGGLLGGVEVDGETCVTSNTCKEQTGYIYDRALLSNNWTHVSGVSSYDCFNNYKCGKAVWFSYDPNRCNYVSGTYAWRVETGVTSSAYPTYIPQGDECTHSTWTENRNIRPKYTNISASTSDECSAAGGSFSSSTTCTPIIGRGTLNIDNSYSSGNVTGVNKVGGLVGQSNKDGDISNSYSNSVISGNDQSGGLVGRNHGTITDSYALGDVDSSFSTGGGLVGYNNGTIEDCFAAGEIHSENNYVGGLIGDNNGDIINSYAVGEVYGSDYIGGLIGISRSGDLENVYSKGDVNGKDYIGGLIGQNNSIINSSYASGDVEGNQYVGGLVGNNTNKISDSYSGGAITAADSSSAGGLIGENISSVENQGDLCEYVGGDITICSSENMKTIRSNWDDSIWDCKDIDYGIPSFSAMPDVIIEEDFSLSLKGSLIDFGWQDNIWGDLCGLTPKLEWSDPKRSYCASKTCRRSLTPYVTAYRVTIDPTFEVDTSNVIDSCSESIWAGAGEEPECISECEVEFWDEGNLSSGCIIQYDKCTLDWEDEGSGMEGYDLECYKYDSKISELNSIWTRIADIEFTSVEDLMMRNYIVESEIGKTPPSAYLPVMECAIAEYWYGSGYSWEGHPSDCSVGDTWIYVDDLNITYK